MKRNKKRLEKLGKKLEKRFWKAFQRHGKRKKGGN